MELARVLDVLRAFERERVDYVLIGAVALALHGLVRATQDVGLFVAPDPANVERAKAALRAVFADPSIDEIASDDLAGGYPTVRYVPDEPSFVVDLIGRLGDAIRYEDLEFEEREIEGVRVRVATPATLYRMKKDTVRCRSSGSECPDAGAGGRGARSGAWSLRRPPARPLEGCSGTERGWLRSPGPSSPRGTRHEARPGR